MAESETAPIIAIDFGTSYSRIAVWNGNAEIILGAQGDTSIPSWVAFTETGTLIGEAAQEQFSENSGNTIFGVKELIGRKFLDPVVAKWSKDWSLQVINDEKNGHPRLPVNYEQKAVSFPPEQVAYEIFKKLKGMAEAHLGKPIKDVVITVPNNFTRIQRDALKFVAEVAGLIVIGILNEGTATAVMCCVENIYNGRADMESTILVFDIGGGNTNVTIATIEDGVVGVKSMTGNTALGGEHFNTRMVTDLVQEFKLRHRKDIASNQGSMLHLRSACEVAKRTLSMCQKAEIEIKNFEGMDVYRTSFTRDRFEILNMDSFQESIDLVNMALTDANMNKWDIDDIILVGGSTRIPKIREMLKEYFDGKEPNCILDPEDEAVCYGAVVQAAVLKKDKSEIIQKMSISDAIPFDLGFKTGDDQNMKIIIAKNTKIPCRQTQVISTSNDYQTSMEIEVFEGYRDLDKDDQFLGKLRLVGIPPTPSGMPEIQITFDIGYDGNITVIAKEMATGNEQCFNTADKLKQNRVQNKATRELEDCEDIIELGKIKRFCESVKATMKNEHVKTKVTDVERYCAVGKCDDMISWTDSMKKEVERKRKELEEFCMPILKRLYKKPRYENGNDMDPQPGTSTNGRSVIVKKEPSASTNGCSVEVKKEPGSL